MLDMANLPDGAAEPAATCLSSATTLHPIHLSIGVSRSAEISEGGAEKASFTPSKRPFRDVDGLALLGCTEKAETVAAVNRRVVVVFMVYCCMQFRLVIMTWNPLFLVMMNKKVADGIRRAA